MEPISTSLGELSNHDWQIMNSRWSRGIDWNVHKLGKRHWEVGGRLGRGAPLFKTKGAAYQYGENLICLEAAHRSWLRLKAEGRI